MNNKRKNRALAPRAPRARNVPAEGVYKNAHFMHAIACHVGDTVQVHTQSDSIWEGVFRTFSAHFDVVLEVAHKVDKDGVVSPDSIVDKMIFKPEDVISIRAKDSDLEYATRDTFQTDSAISKYSAGRNPAEEKCLQPWDGEGVANGDGLGDSLERLDQLDHRANGWDANDMFRKNEQDYGVQSTFDQSLSGYTMQFQKKDTPEFRDAEEKAAAIAADIESQPLYKRRLELENGDEEERFAAVQRPPSNRSSSSAPVPNGGASAQTGDKYVPPNRRKNPQTGKLIKSSPQVPQQPNPAVQPKGPSAPPPGSQYPSLPHHPGHQQPPHQAHVVPMNPQPAKTYAAAGAGVPPASQPPAGHNYRSPSPFIPHVHGGQPPTGGKVNGTDGAPKKPSPAPMQQRPPRHLGHQPHPTATPAPFPIPTVPPSGPPPQLVHQEPAAVQISPHQIAEQTHPGQPIVGGPAGAPQAVAIQTPGGAVQRNRDSRRQEEVQELRKFGSEFKLQPDGASADGPAKPPGVHQEARDPPRKDAPSKPQTSPDRQHQPKQQQQQHCPPDASKTASANHVEANAASGQTGAVASQPSDSSVSSSADKVSAGPKKSTLNPNAKEFNPAAKSFIPRSPSTPNPSRPHTPGTPVGAGGPMGPPQYIGGVGHNVHHPAAHQHHLGGGAVMVGGASAYTAVLHPHHASPAPAFHQQPQTHHPRFRKMQMSSQMQVANATGQPLLTPAPIPQFMPYPHSTHPQPPPQYQQMSKVRSLQTFPIVRVYEGATGGGPVQYLAAQPAPPSTPSPGQGYHPPPSPAVGPGPPHPPPQPYQTQHFPMICPILPPSQSLYLPPQPPQAQQPQQHHAHIPMMIPPPPQGGGQAGQHP